MSAESFEGLLKAGWPTLSGAALERISLYYKLVLQENEIQNLTRLLTPKEFFEGHVVDVMNLLEAGFVTYPALDLGSGCGVPGLLAALSDEDPEKRWILCESEQRKAEFLARAAEELGVSSRVLVFKGRAEEFLKTGTAGSIVVRAVGPVERIFNWIRNCSTWNNLVLLKGPRWSEEWAEFCGSNPQTPLKVAENCAYEVGEDRKKTGNHSIGSCSTWNNFYKKGYSPKGDPKIRLAQQKKVEIFRK